MDHPSVFIAFNTCPDLAVAEQLADALVSEGLAACVNIVPAITSVYRWEGKLQRDQEVLLIIKTTEPAVSALRAQVERLHPYDVPELVALPVTGGLPAYLRWVVDAVDQE